MALCVLAYYEEELLYVFSQFPLFGILCSMFLFNSENVEFHIFYIHFLLLLSTFAAFGNGDIDLLN